MPVSNTFGNGFNYKRLSAAEQQQRGILGRLVGPIADTLHSTRNGRLYGAELWKTALNDDVFKEKIANKCVLGELGHPADREETDITKAAVCLAEMPKLSSDGKIYGIFDILNTPSGQILKALCDYGTTVGISSRGSGEVNTDFDGNQTVDPESYNLECWDVVLVPAVKDARLQYTTEALNKKRYNKTLRQTLSESLNKFNENDKKELTEVLNNVGLNLVEAAEEDNKMEDIEKNNVEIVIGAISNGDGSDDDYDEAENTIIDAFNIFNVEQDKVRFTTELVRKFKPINGDLADCTLYGIIDIMPSADLENKLQQVCAQTKNGDVTLIAGISTDNDYSSVVESEVEAPLDEANESDTNSLEDDDTLDDSSADLSDIIPDDIPYEADEGTDDEGSAELSDRDIDEDNAAEDSQDTEEINDKEMEKALSGQEAIDKLDALEVGMPVVIQMTDSIDPEQTLYAGKDEIQGRETYNFFNNEGFGKAFGVSRDYILGHSDFKANFDSNDPEKVNELTNAFKSENSDTGISEALVNYDFGDTYLTDFDVDDDEAINVLVDEFGGVQNLIDDAKSVLPEGTFNDCQNDTDYIDALRNNLQEYVDASQKAYNIIADAFSSQAKEDHDDAKAYNKDPEGYYGTSLNDSLDNSSGDNLEESDNSAVQAFPKDMCPQNGKCKKEEECNTIKECSDKKKVNEAVSNRSETEEFVAELKEVLKENKKLREDNKALQEKLSVSIAKETKLNETVDNYKKAAARLSTIAKEVKPLKESLSKANVELSEKNALEGRLNEVTTSVEQYKAKINESTKQLAKAEKLAESYKANYNTLKRELIKTKSDLYGVDANKVVVQLGKSFKVSDIDRVCESLSMVNRNINKLPINLTESVKLSRNMKVRLDDIKSEDANSDDYVDPSLLNLL